MIKRLIWFMLLSVAYGQSTIQPTSIPQTSLNLPSPTVPVNLTVTMTATLVPSGTDATSLCNNTAGAWASATPSVATISSAGVVTGVAGGTSVVSCQIPSISGSITGSGTVTVASIPAITNPSCGTPPCQLPQGTNGTAYSFTFTAVGGVLPYTWAVSVGSLPGWASLNASTGAVTGTPNANATTNFTIQVTDSNGVPNINTLAVSLTVVASGACGPTTGYACSCTSTATVAPPTNAPFSGITGAGTLVNDPEPAGGGNNSGCFHNPIARVTDKNTGTNACTAQSQTCAQKANLSWFSNTASGDVSQWSSDSSMFLAVDSGNTDAIFNFNTSTMATSTRYYNFQSVLKWFNGPAFSRNTAKLIYAWGNTAGTAAGPVLASYDASQSWPTLPTRTIIYDFSSSVNGVPSTAIHETDPPNINTTDTIFLDGFGASSSQNSQNYAAAYKIGSGVSTYKTDSGTVTGDWGTVGTVICQNCVVSSSITGMICSQNGSNTLCSVTVASTGGFTSGDSVTISGNAFFNGTVSATVTSSTTFTFTIIGVNVGSGSGGTAADNTPSPGLYNLHNVKMSQDGKYAILAQGGSCLSTVCQNGQSPFFWQIGTTKVWVKCPSQCGGHFIGGFNVFLNQYNTPFWVSNPFNPGNVPVTGTTFPSTYCGTPSQTFDQHPSWWNNKGSDQEPFFFSTTSTSHVPNYNMCTVDEIIAMYAPANSANSGKIIRFAHNYITNVSQFCPQNGIMTESQDGSWGLFCSPMATTGTSTGQLGDTSGNFPCSTSVCRSDIFIVKEQ